MPKQTYYGIVIYTLVGNITINELRFFTSSSYVKCRKCATELNNLFNSGERPASKQARDIADILYKALQTGSKLINALPEAKFKIRATVCSQ